MKKTFLIFLLAFLACFANAQMPVFRNQFTTNVPGAYVRGNSTFGTGGTGTYTFNGQLLTYVDALGGVDFMVSTNVYGVGTPLMIIRNGTVGFNMDSQGTYSVSASSYFANRITADNYLYTPAVWFGETLGRPRLEVWGGGIAVNPQIGTTNWFVWCSTNSTPVSVVNSNGWFGINTNTPTDWVEVHGGIRATNFQLIVPQWDDVRIPLGALGSPSSQPNRPNFIGTIKAYAFDAAADEELHFELQIPHGIATNYPIDLHLHWSGITDSVGANSNVVWGLEYVVANVYDIFPAGSTTVYGTNGIISARENRMADILELDPGIVTESAILMGRLFRDADNGSDNYPNDAYGLSLDAHYAREKFGSFAEDGDY